MMFRDPLLKFGEPAAAEPEFPHPTNAGRVSPFRFRMYVLGRFQLFRGEARIEFSSRAQCKSLELLQALIALGGTDVSAVKLTDAVWPDSEGDAAHRAFESALHRLRCFLKAPDVICLANGKLGVDRSQFWVDMLEFEQALQSPDRGDAESVARVARARQLYQGHLLEREMDRSWMLIPRQALRNRFLGCIRHEAEFHEDRKQWSEAALVYQTALERDALAEDLYRGLMRCQRELGEYSEALKTYRSCRELLTKVLGVLPSAKTQDLHQSVRQRALKAALPAAPRELRSGWVARPTANQPAL